MNNNVIDICNYPILDNLIASNEKAAEQSKYFNYICYIGAIAKIRGIYELVQALELTKNKVILNLAGDFAPASFERELKNLPGWKHVNYLGFLKRQQVNEVLGKSVAGIVTFFPAANHINAQPNKMFEYMAAGIPVIASNFSLWREIIEGNQCGICVDPHNSKAIGDAMQYLIDNPKEAKQMGKNGRKAVEQKYNWPIEEKKLLTLYKDLLQ
jgi:glycosyltransferase involved in cell wall biosynthesis